MHRTHWATAPIGRLALAAGLVAAACDGAPPPAKPTASKSKSEGKGKSVDDGANAPPSTGTPPKAPDAKAGPDAPAGDPAPIASTEPHPFSARDMLAMDRISGHEVSPDGTAILFLSCRGGSMQVWRVPTAGGEATQVTDLPLPVGNLVVGPAG
ncbi:MAG: hypothetical protein AAF721_33715, partial [Myxococcota bacterium]